MIEIGNGFNHTHENRKFTAFRMVAPIIVVALFFVAFVCTALGLGLGGFRL